MEAKTLPVNDIASREIIISRLINAPQSLVFEVWTDPKHIDKWWGPNGFTNTTKKMEVKNGGVWDYTMHGMGMDFPGWVNYLEVVAPERLVYTLGSMENDSASIHATVTFEARGLKTLLTMRSLFNTAAQRDMAVKEYNAIESGNQTVTRFEQRLAEVTAEKEMVFTRVLKAPRELVFKAWTEAERLAQWWGPKGLTLSVSKLDLREGGSFLYCAKDPSGFEMWGKFVYHEIVAPERIVFVVSFSDKDGNIARAPFSATWPLEIMNTLTLTEENGMTTLILRGGPINATDEEKQTFEQTRTSMDKGFEGTFDELEEYLAKEQK